VAKRLRHDNMSARTVTIKIKLGRPRGEMTSRLDSSTTERKYPLLTRSKTLPQPTDDAAVIREVAIALWNASGVDEPIRLLGVSMSNLEPQAQHQLALFGPAAEGGEQERSRRLGPALDAIRKRFGEDAIAVATGDPQKATFSTRKKSGV
jgi:hypothetical protein